MEFAFRAPLILPADFQSVAVDLTVWERDSMPGQSFLSEHVQANAFDAGRRPRKILIDDIMVQADGFENLRAAIALNRRDAHLGHGLHYAFDGSLDELLNGLVMVDIRQHLFPDHVFESLEHQIRVDRAAAVTDQQREMMHLARLA